MRVVRAQVIGHHRSVLAESLREGEMEKVEISLKRAPDEARVNDPKFQEELTKFSKSLRAAGISYSQRGMAFDAVDAVGYALPEFVVALKAIGPTLGTLGVIFVAYLQGRYGRKIRLKIGEIEVEARTVEEVENLLEKIKQFQQEYPSSADDS
jgi:hypothetical protein